MARVKLLAGSAPGPRRSRGIPGSALQLDPAGSGHRRLVAVLLVALAARLPGLDGPLWFDEIVTLVESVRLPAWELVASYPRANQHMLYSVLANLTTSVLGETPFALRLPSMVFGLLAIFTTMEFVRLLALRCEAVMVGLLFALSYHAVWFSQNARGYTGLMFFLMASFALFYLGWNGRWRVWPWYAVAVALGIYTHLTMLVVPATHATILLLEGLAPGLLGQRAAPGARRRAWLALAGSGALTLLLYWPAMPEIVAYYTTLRPGDTGSTDPAALFHDLVGGLGANPALAPASLLLAAMGVLGALDYGRQRRLALAMMALSAMWGILLMLAVGSGAAPRFFSYLLPIALILAVRGIVVATGRWRGWALAGLVVLSAASLYFCYRYPKQDFTGALAYARQHAAPNASVAGIGLAATAYRLYYAPDVLAIYSEEDYDAALNRGSETWVLLTFPRDMRARFGPLYDRLQEDFGLAATFPGTLGDGYLFVYYRPARGGAG